MRFKIFGNGSKQKLYFMFLLEKYIRQACKSHTGLYRPIQVHTGPYRPVQAHTGSYKHFKNLMIAFYNRKGQKYVG
jgi:hypothetical protein